MGRKYEYIESIAKDVYQKYIKRHSGNLKFEDFFELSKLPCFYCASPPYQEHKKYGARKTKYSDGYIFIYNGLDRINNNKGYDLDNVVPCCKKCNWMRHAQTTDEFFERIAKIIYNHKKYFNKFGINVKKV